MKELKKFQERIFTIANEDTFNDVALEVFRFQYHNTHVYQQFCNALGVDPRRIDHYQDIPFLPIAFFKSHDVICESVTSEVVFRSSGTTGIQTSRHYVHDLNLYIKSFMNSFRRFMGEPSDYHILALLPGYLEREGSSLIYMVNHLIAESQSGYSGFYLYDTAELSDKINSLKNDPRKVLLLGVSFALLDMAEKFNVQHPRLYVMETGGMKGQRREMVREELHHVLKKAFHVEKIFSEYGMTELLSQAWSDGNGIFTCPPWMKILARDVNDPRSFARQGNTGGLSVLDLANLYSCSFIATQDLVKILPEDQFEVIGRFDNSDIRGCNLLLT